MYRRIVIALDGSELAERVLPYVEALAEKFGSAVTLLRATTPPGTIIARSAGGADAVAAPVVDPAPIVEAERLDAAAYLAELTQRLRDEGWTVDHVQPEGPVAETIVAHADQAGADLIAMTTHGLGGLGRLVLGSVADEVVRTAHCPVLLVRVREEDGQAG